MYRTEVILRIRTYQGGRVLQDETRDKETATAKIKKSFRLLSGSYLLVALICFFLNVYYADQNVYGFGIIALLVLGAIISDYRKNKT